MAVLEAVATWIRAHWAGNPVRCPKECTQCAGLRELCNCDKAGRAEETLARRHSGIHTFDPSVPKLHAHSTRPPFLRPAPRSHSSISVGVHHPQGGGTAFARCTSARRKLSRPNCASARAKPTTAQRDNDEPPRHRAARPLVCSPVGSFSRSLARSLSRARPSPKANGGRQANGLLALERFQHFWLFLLLFLGSLSYLIIKQTFRQVTEPHNERPPRERKAEREGNRESLGSAVFSNQERVAVRFSCLDLVVFGRNQKGRISSVSFSQ